MIGYDLRRNESVSYDYNKMFAPNMYSKVNQDFKRFENNNKTYFFVIRRREKSSKNMTNPSLCSSTSP